MKKEEKATQWFIEPIGSHTNGIVGDWLNAQGGVPGAEFALYDSTGEKHDVFLVPDYKFVDQVIKSRQDLELIFLVWNRGGDNEAIQLWPYGGKKKKVVKKIKLPVKKLAAIK